MLPGCVTLSQIPLSLMLETTLTNKEKICLYHLHLGHPSPSTIEIMFPILFQKVDEQMFHCNTCEFAKHKHVNFPSPSCIPNLFGTRWFLIFIDDCTLMTWLFLEIKG